MTDILHLIDDAGLGGVTRVLADHLPRLSGPWRHQVELVNPTRRLPPPTRADIVVVHFTLNWAKLPYLLGLKARIDGRRMVLVEHSYTGAYERCRVRNRSRFRTMLRLGYAMADRVVAVSQAQSDWMCGAGLAAESKLVAIPQARDLSAFAAVPARSRCGPLRIAAYGRYVSQKGFDVLIEAMRQISPDVAAVEFAGYGPDLDAMRAAAADLPHVTIGGTLDDPSSLLARADVVAVPSRWEAFGLVAAEARAAGRPVIASGVDGLAEQIDPAWGLIAAPDNPGQLAAAIRALAAADLRLMGAAARRSVANDFDRTIARWESLLHELVPNAAASRRRLAGSVANDWAGHPATSAGSVEARENS